MKKNKNIIDKQYNGESIELKKILYIFIGVVIFFLFAYFVGGIVTGNIKLKKDKKEEVSIQYTEILAEMTFKQKEDSYFVMYYNFDSNEANLLDALQNGLQSEGTVYKVDLNKNFNKNYITEGEPKTNPSNINELKVKNPTLIKVNNKKVSNFVVGTTNIKNYISKLK